MFSKPNLVFLTKLILVISIFLPVVNVGAAGNLRLVNKNENSVRTQISFSNNERTKEGYGIVAEQVCVNGELVKLNSTSNEKYTNIPNIGNVYYGSILDITPSDYVFKSPKNNSCVNTQTEELKLSVKKNHIYRIGFVSDNNGGYVFKVSDDQFNADVTITMTDRKLITGYSSAEIPTCIDNKLVSTLSNSSKMAFLTTTEDPSVPRITVGQHIISTYENDKCTDNSTTIDIQPNTWYIYEVPLADGKTQVNQSSPSIPTKIIQPKSEPKALLETVRTGGYNFNFGVLLILISSLLQIINLAKPKVQLPRK